MFRPRPSHARPAPRTRSILAATLLLLLLTSTRLAAQHEYDVWYFGFGHKLTFNGGTVALTTEGPMAALQGCATICDPATGAPLFSTNGAFVWDRNNTIMPGGSGLNGQASSIQAALIVPAPGSTRLYYIFTTDESESPAPPNGYYYSVVDMGLRGGLGDVIAKNVQLMPEVSEHQTAVRDCNGRDFWAIAHDIQGRSFRAFHITAAGVEATPVLSSLGSAIDGHGSSFGSKAQGALKASPDGSRLAMTLGDGTVELFRFNRSTGQVTDAVRLRYPAHAYFHYGLSFSPDGNMLYVSGDDGLYQFSLASGDPATMAGSIVKVSAWPGADLALGPDGRIFRRIGNGNNWSVISAITSPNSAGIACGVIDQAYPMPGRVYEASYGLSNNIDAMHPRLCSVHASIIPAAGEICQGTGLTLDGSGSIGSSWEWSFPGGNPSGSVAVSPTVSFPTPGGHAIRLIVRDGALADTASLIVDVRESPIVDLGPDRSICVGRCIDLLSTVSGGDLPYTYVWWPEENLSCNDCPTPVACPGRTTTYHLRVNGSHGCVGEDSVTIHVDAPTRARIAIPRDLAVPPGSVAEVPVVLIDSLDLALVPQLRLTIRYQSSIMRLLPEGGTNGGWTDGTLLDGWSAQTIVDQPGVLTLDLTAPPGVQVGRRAGVLLRLRFATFLSAVREGSLPVTLSSELPIEPVMVDSCVMFDPAPGLLTMKLCGLAYRLIEMTGGKYAIDAITPNPIGPAAEITFSLGLDGQTRLEIFDAVGHRVTTLLDTHLDAGSYGVTWDAAVPDGIYYCRLTSGAWSDTRRVVVGH